MTAAARVRSRSLELGETAKTPLATPEMVGVAKEVYQANQEKNKHTRAEGAARKTLAQMMATAGEAALTYFTFRIGAKNIDVNYSQKSVDTISLDKLISLVGVDAVLKIATVTQGAVKEAFGANTLNQVLKSAPGDWDVKVKERGKR